jgi:hypothetical protein
MPAEAKADADFDRRPIIVRSVAVTVAVIGRRGRGHDATGKRRREQRQTCEAKSARHAYLLGTLSVPLEDNAGARRFIPEMNDL